MHTHLCGRLFHRGACQSAKCTVFPCSSVENYFKMAAILNTVNETGFEVTLREAGMEE